VRHRRALVAAHVGHAGLQQRLGDGQDAFAVEGGAGLHMSDIGEGRFLPDLMSALSRAAPGVRLETVSLPTAELTQALTNGHVDFAFGFLPNLLGAGLARAQLLQDKYCVLLRHGHPFLSKQISPEALLDHLRDLEFVAVRSHTDTLRILQWLQLEDQIRLTTEHFTVLPSIVRATDLAVVMPRAIAMGFDAGYAVVEPALPHGRPAEQKVTFQARHAPFAQCTERARYRSGAHNRRNAPASPHQPHRFLPWSQGVEDQKRGLILFVSSQGPHGSCGPLFCAHRIDVAPFQMGNS
jgi:DNA-binding transcriptional LysR family regulator